MSTAKPLNTFSATFLIVASMLGTGILTTTGIILELVKSPLIALGIWVAGGGLALIGAWCYGELARHLPHNGGEATILHHLFSPVLGEIAGLTSFVVGFAACNAATALALSDYLHEALPGLGLPAKLIACLALLLVTGLHGFLGPLGLRIQTLLAIGKFGLLLGLTFYGLFLVSPASFATADPVPSASPGAAWGIAMMLVMFAYSGWNAAIYVAGEIHEPARNVRRAMVFGTTIIAVLYVAINSVVLSVLPASALEGVRPVIAVLVRHLFGADASALFAGLVAFAMLSSLGVAAFLGPRVLDCLLQWRQRPPGSAAQSPIARVRPTLVWLQAGVSIFMVLTGTFLQILTVMGFLLGLFPILCVLGLYRLQGRQGWTRRLLAPVFILVSTAILLLGAAQSPVEVAMALALVGFFFLARLGLSRWA